MSKNKVQVVAPKPVAPATSGVSTDTIETTVDDKTVTQEEIDTEVFESNSDVDFHSEESEEISENEEFSEKTIGESDEISSENIKELSLQGGTSHDLKSEPLKVVIVDTPREEKPVVADTDSLAMKRFKESVSKFEVARNARVQDATTCIYLFEEILRIALSYANDEEVANALRTYFSKNAKSIPGPSKLTFSHQSNSQSKKMSVLYGLLQRVALDPKSDINKEYTLSILGDCKLFHVFIK